MKARDLLGAVLPRQAEPPVVRAARSVPHPSVGGLVRSGVAAGVTVVALSAASAAASAVRRRVEGS